MPRSIQAGSCCVRRARLAALILCAGTCPGIAAAQESGGGADGRSAPDTPAEAEAYLSYTPEADIARFLEELATSGGSLRVDTLAWQEDLPILLATPAPPNFPARRRGGTGRPKVLVIGLQHGDEQAGKEAALQLIRDAAFGALDAVLSDVDLLVIPALNPWGGRQGSRYDPNSTDLNRDHMRLSAVATRVLHEVFERFRPHAVLDLHELGPVAYDVQIAVPTHPNVDSRLKEFARFYVLPRVVNDLAESDVTFHEYVSTYPEPPHSGEFLTYAPIAANNARNVFALSGAVSFLVETSSSRDIEGLGIRTDRLLAAARSLLRSLAAQGRELVDRVEASRGQLPYTVVLDARNEADPRQPSLTWRVRSGPGMFHTETVRRWKPLVKPVLEVRPAAAYLVDPAEEGLLNLLVRHGIRMREVVTPIRMTVGRYPVGAVEAAVEAEELVPENRSADDLISWEEVEIGAGTRVVVPQPPFARLLFTLLEPYSRDGWFALAPGIEPGSTATYPVVRIDDAAALSSLLRVTRPARDSDRILAE